MKQIKPYKTVAEAVRVEYIKEADKVFLVFEIVDEAFKKKIKEDFEIDGQVCKIDMVNKLFFLHFRLSSILS